jgi:hypothetical protein
MTKLRTLLVAAAVATAAAVSIAAPASAGICDQQGHRVLIKKVWHKVVTGPRGGYIDCGLGW